MIATPRPRGESGSGMAQASEDASKPVPQSTTAIEQMSSRTVNLTS